MAQSTATRATLFVLRELIGELLYFPVWWYSHGLASTSRALTRKWYNLLNRLAIPILARTMGRPMYGDYTRSGRVISFFFRLLLLGTRLFVLVGWTLMLLLALLAWVLGPIVAGGMLIRQVIPL
jgi:hypothetical protein